MWHAFLPRFRYLQIPVPACCFHGIGNIWSNVFDKTTINATNGLRLPYNDKASMKPTPEEKAACDGWGSVPDVFAAAKTCVKQHD